MNKNFKDNHLDINIKRKRLAYGYKFQIYIPKTNHWTYSKIINGYKAQLKVYFTDEYGYMYSISCRYKQHHYEYSDDSLNIEIFEQYISKITELFEKITE